MLFDLQALTSPMSLMPSLTGRSARPPINRKGMSMKGTKSVGTALLTAALLIPALSNGVHAKPQFAIPQGGTVIAAESDISESLNPHLNQQLSTVDIDSAVFDGLVK